MLTLVFKRAQCESKCLLWCSGVPNVSEPWGPVGPGVPKLRDLGHSGSKSVVECYKLLLPVAFSRTLLHRVWENVPCR